MDIIGGSQRSCHLNCPGLLLGWFYCPARMVAIERTFGLGQGPGCCAYIGRLCTGFRSFGCTCLGFKCSWDRNRHSLWAWLCLLYIDGSQGIPGWHQSMDNITLHLLICSNFPFFDQPFSGLKTPRRRCPFFRHVMVGRSNSWLACSFPPCSR